MTEPTEEQKQAAEAFCVGNLMGYVWQVARLLAEREAKLREEYQSPTQDVVISQLRARVAELEERERFRDLAAEVDTGEPADSILIRALTERAAQHLADIKALMGFVCFVDEGYDHDEDAHRYGTPCRCCMANHLRHRLAHYDDAKAAEGGEG